MKKPKTKAHNKTIYQLKITLKDVKPAIWRRFLVESDVTLYKLFIILLDVMGWVGGHLHEFEINGEHYGSPDPDDDFSEDIIDEKKVRLNDVIQAERDRFVFEYDFGDGWEHEVIVEKILPYEEGVKYPVCLEGERACPPEDCGGPFGYQDLLKAIQNPKHPEHKSSLKWLDRKFDPEEFDAEEVNLLLKDVGKIKPWFEGL